MVDKEINSMFLSAVQVNVRKVLKNRPMSRRSTEARAASNFRWRDAKVLAPSRLVLGGGLFCLRGCDASPAPSLQKNFREDENLFFRSVTGLANLGIGSGTLQ